MNEKVVSEKTAFPFAPFGWDGDEVTRAAAEEGIELNEDHLQVVKALQEYFSKHDKPEMNMRELHDALDEKFHHKGGMRYLYKLLPGGPVAQGCRLAGLLAPAGALDRSFGSVQ